MPTHDWIVLAAGIAAILWINWYFLLSGRRAARAMTTSGRTQEVVVTVEGGYDPAVIRVRHGVPVRIIFDRREASGCSEEVVFPDFHLQRFLPPFERTPVEFTPERPGTYEFTCGMRMLRGRVVAE
ncbi:MAG: cupredoxin domain-containing protein [Gemmatimonadales bacterium]